MKKEKLQTIVDMCHLVYKVNIMVVSMKDINIFAKF